MPPELDVYQPPKTEVGVSSAEQPRFYSARQVWIASFIGGPMAGCLLLGSNYAALGRASARVRAIVVGVVATVVLFALVLVLPKNFPHSAVPMAYSGALYGFAKTTEGAAHQGRPPAAHQSSWKAVGIGFASLIMLLVLFVSYFVLVGDDS